MLDGFLVAEVEPPQRRAQREREQRDDGEIEIQRTPDRPGADDDDRLAERDNDDEPVPLAEVLGSDDESFGAREPRREPEQEGCAGPQELLRAAAEGAAQEDEARRPSG